MDILTIKGLKKRFGEKEVLKGLDLCVKENSIFGFVGRNGAGKTTTMKAILGLITTDAGEIYLSGERVKYGDSRTNRYIGYLPDVPQFYSFMTAREYLKLCGESLSMKKNDIEKRSEELLLLVGLSEEKGRIKGYSRGMKQRLGIAQALLARPKLLICDEPTSALDPIGRKEILDILLSARKETTVLFSTHILSDVERICTDVALIEGGTIAMQGSVDDLKRAHSIEEITVELTDAEAAQKLLSLCGGARLTDKTTFVLSGGEQEMLLLLDIISKNHISVCKIERTEASLESLFLEVVKK